MKKLIEQIGRHKNPLNEGWTDWKQVGSLKPIVDLSKKNKTKTFLVTDDNYSRIGTFWLKNGKFAKQTVANSGYDFMANKTTLRARNDVIYKYKMEESLGVKLLNKIVENIKEAREPYPVYHPSYSSAVQSAEKYAQKKGFEVDEDDWATQIALGPRKPGKGKTNRFVISLTKNGKPNNSTLALQVFNRGVDGNTYELNCYVNVSNRKVKENVNETSFDKFRSKFDFHGNDPVKQGKSVKIKKGDKIIIMQRSGHFDRYNKILINGKDDVYITDDTLDGIMGNTHESNKKIREDKNPGFRFSRHKKTFRDSVSRMRKSYDTTTDSKKKSKIKDWLKYATQHKKDMTKNGWED